MNVQRMLNGINWIYIIMSFFIKALLGDKKPKTASQPTKKTIVIED